MPVNIIILIVSLLTYTVAIATKITARHRLKGQNLRHTNRNTMECPWNHKILMYQRSVLKLLLCLVNKHGDILMDISCNAAHFLNYLVTVCSLDLLILYRLQLVKSLVKLDWITGFLENNQLLLFMSAQQKNHIVIAVVLILVYLEHLILSMITIDHRQ